MERGNLSMDELSIVNHVLLLKWKSNEPGQMLIGRSKERKEEREKKKKEKIQLHYRTR